MVKSRNCLCGSKKPFNECCGSETNLKLLENKLHNSRLIYNPITNKPFYLTNDALINQLQRDIRNFSINFDDLFKDDLQELSELYSEALSILLTGVYQTLSQQDELMQTISFILKNALDSILASLVVLRSGLVLQPCMILRHVIESISFALYLFEKPDSIQKFKNKQLKPTRSIDFAKKIIPSLGTLWGLLSNEFVHINQLHTNIHFTESYDHDVISEPVKININYIFITTYIITIALEYIYYSHISEHHFWTKIGINQFKYENSEKFNKWLNKALKDV